MNGILSDKKVYEFRKNELLIEQGTPFSNAICVQDGVVKIYKTNKNQNEFIYWFAQPGDILGLDAFINNENYSFSARAIETVHACMIGPEDLNNILEHKPDVSMELMKMLCEKIEFMEHRMTSIAQKDIKAQLAEVLLILLVDKNKVAKKVSQINYSIKDLANIIGTRQNYIYKILTDFSQQNIINIIDNKIKVMDEVKLATVASGK